MRTSFIALCLLGSAMASTEDELEGLARSAAQKWMGKYKYGTKKMSDTLLNKLRMFDMDHGNSDGEISMSEVRAWLSQNGRTEPTELAGLDGDADWTQDPSHITAIYASIVDENNDGLLDEQEYKTILGYLGVNTDDFNRKWNERLANFKAQLLNDVKNALLVDETEKLSQYEGLSAYWRTLMTAADQDGDELITLREYITSQNNTRVNGNVNEGRFWAGLWLENDVETIVAQYGETYDWINDKDLIATLYIANWPGDTTVYKHGAKLAWLSSLSKEYKASFHNQGVTRAQIADWLDELKTREGTVNTNNMGIGNIPASDNFMDNFMNVWTWDSWLADKGLDEDELEIRYEDREGYDQISWFRGAWPNQTNNNPGVRRMLFSTTCSQMFGEDVMEPFLESHDIQEGQIFQTSYEIAFQTVRALSDTHPWVFDQLLPAVANSSDTAFDDQDLETWILSWQRWADYWPPSAPANWVPFDDRIIKSWPYTPTKDQVAGFTSSVLTETHNLLNTISITVDRRLEAEVNTTELAEAAEYIIELGDYIEANFVQQ